MVMKRNAMRKNLRQSILKSFGRYIAIVLIIALGAAMFVGLLMTKTDMVATGKNFTDEMNMFDLRIMNSYGWTQADVDKIAGMEGVVHAEGLLYTDIIVRVGDTEDDSVYRIYSMPQKINQVSLRGGRMPEKADECVIVGYQMDDSVLGTVIRISDTNTEDALDTLVEKTLTVVGYVATPLYMDMNRGTTAVGNGSLANCLYVLPEAMELDYIPEINITIPGDYDLYTKQYNDAMQEMADWLEPQLEEMAQNRYETVKAEAMDAYREGLKEYAEGVWGFQEGKETAQKELEDAYQKLLDAEKTIADSEQQLISGEAQLADGRLQLEEGQKELDAAREEFDSMKESAYATYDMTESSLRKSREEAEKKVQQLEAEIAVIEAELAKLNEQIGPDGELLEELNNRITQLDGQIYILDESINAAVYTRDMIAAFPGADTGFLEQMDARIADMRSQVESLRAQRTELAAQRDTLQAQIGTPDSERKELESQKNQLDRELAVQQAALDAIDSGLAATLEAKAVLDEQFAAAEAEILAGEQQLKEGQAAVAQAEQQIIDGRRQLEEGKLELADGWVAYENGKAEAEAELADAEAELKKAKQELLDAADLIDQMTQSSLFILDRNSNVGYNSLDSASNIVQGVARVFPAFFLLVAALVCITTMTRMIEEERTQIGTLKALGYSNGAIISKYLIYAGSGAVIGCGLGVFLGSAVFPIILWQAYKIMLYITDGIVLKINWWLCGAVVGAYTTVMLLVTWYCCKRTLAEAPAELIRPKSPDPGKKILLEYLPVWQKISFLNKVTIRNIFRYKQRLAMMMVGIGGCTALLLTGFGLRDSIVNVVDYQFEEVTTYDMSVYFSENQTEEEQADFLKDVSVYAEDAMFYHQSSMELSFDNRTKEIYVIASGSGLEHFIDLHVGEEKIALPGANEVVISVGAAEAMGIDVGDQVTLRNADMQVLNLTVSGIYDNHVENYAIVSPAAMELQWGQAPETQMAFVKLREGEDAHAVSAEISSLLDVMNVSVSEDFANMVGNMMEALDLVVWVVVFCAGLLAAIVLYNLTNININERIREIATIKVLGFNASETGAYVFKENLSLSAIGSVVGLGLGYLLLLFVMSQIKIDMVWFKALATPMSYILSIALTMLAAVIVDFVFYFKLDKINMAEALKSVE